MTERTIVVHADVDGSPRVVGRLTAIAAKEHEEAHLEFHPLWQRTTHHRVLQPMLRCLRGPHLGGGTMPLFGAIGDSAPDRWGRTLMRRAERKRAWREKRPARVLSEMDFLLGVNDELRAGSLRFAEREGGSYAGETAAPIPSVDNGLERLLDAVRAHECDEETPAQTELLLKTGQLLGGSRPKATVRDRDGHLLVAKFPSRGDSRDMQRWEALALSLARECGICVPAFDLVPTAQALRPREMAISLDGVDDRAALQPLFDMAERFALGERAARAEAARVARVTRRWRDRAKEMRIPRDQIHSMRGAFEHEELEQALRG